VEKLRKVARSAASVSIGGECSDREHRGAGFVTTARRRILLWHGYLLTGSGSNIYTANLARCWRAAGHDVLVMCQERAAHELDYVDAAGDFAPDNSSWRTRATAARRASGTCTVVRPYIHGLLPVYVYDDYEGFTVRRFTELDDEELDRYTSDNVTALVTAIERFEPHAIITGHEVMGPEIARRARKCTGAGYIAKLHGSALEYAVKVQERYRDHARSGLGAASHVTGGSRYMIEAAAAVVPGSEERAVVVNPGCDVELFRPLPGARVPGLVGYVGKLIAAKGVHHLLASLGLTSAGELRVAIVGYGELEQDLRGLADALAEGDVARAAAWARAHGEASLEAFLRARIGAASYAERSSAVSVEFLGRLDHGPLSRVLPTFTALAVPSVVPEAFGMVAAEAAACGVLPIVPRHSGIGETGAAIEQELGAPALLGYDPGDAPGGIAGAIDRVLGLPPERRARWDEALVAMARARWSWNHVAERLLDIALDG
jgi:glycosyltransferase involved in cell wall biosynthesis